MDKQMDGKLKNGRSGRESSQDSESGILDFPTGAHIVSMTHNFVFGGDVGIQRIPADPRQVR
ncbi:hypothetical protein [Embleya sp. NPDC005575]|uniref:hypothetical protein n=1 Tax=Embleya sp. NPDC005575 TaxID=3156892 RepID=UPI0033BBADDC